MKPLTSSPRSNPHPHGANPEDSRDREGGRGSLSANHFCSDLIRADAVADLAKIAGTLPIASSSSSNEPTSSFRRLSLSHDDIPTSYLRSDVDPVEAEREADVREARYSRAIVVLGDHHEDHLDAKRNRLVVVEPTQARRRHGEWRGRRKKRRRRNSANFTQNCTILSKIVPFRPILHDLAQFAPFHPKLHHFSSTPFHLPCSILHHYTIFYTLKNCILCMLELRASLGLRARDWPQRGDPARCGVGSRAATAASLASRSPASAAPVFRGSAGPGSFPQTPLCRLFPRVESLNAFFFPLPGSLPHPATLPRTLALLDLPASAINGFVLSSLARSGRDGGGSDDPWLTVHGDPTRVFLTGDSVGANIVHNAAAREGAAAEGVMPRARLFGRFRARQQTAERTEFSLYVQDVAIETITRGSKQEHTIVRLHKKVSKT